MLTHGLETVVSEVLEYLDVVEDVMDVAEVEVDLEVVVVDEVIVVEIDWEVVVLDVVELPYPVCCPNQLGILGSNAIIA